MAANKRKILEAARKLAQKGAKPKALKEYQKLLKLDPNDAKLRLEVGDAYRRWGEVAEAVETYRKVADSYMKDGFDARAVAVYKQILNLDPEHFACYECLAELYQRMGLASEAIGALQVAADGYHKQGKKNEALGLLRKMATLDPANTTSRLKVADLLKQEGLEEDAIAEYEALLDELERQSDLEGAVRACERILEIEPERLSALLRIAGFLIARGQGDRAEAHVKRALEQEPNEPEILEQLAQVYQSQGRDAELADAYRRLAEAHRNRGNEDKAREIIQRFVPPDTLDAENIAPLAPDEGLFGDLGLGDGSPHAGDEDEFGHENVLQTDQSDVLLTDETGAGDEIELKAPAGPESPSRSEQPLPTGEPDQLLAEASVYLRYGKRDQAIANLEAILVQEPRYRPALEKLGETHADGGDAARAVATWLRAADVARSEGSTDALRVLKGRIEALDAEAAAQLDTASPEPPETSVPDAPEPPQISLSEAEAEATIFGGDASSTGARAEGNETEIDLDDIEIDLDTSPFQVDAPAEDESATADEAEIEIEIDGDEVDEVVEDPAAAASSPSVAGPDASTSTSEQIVEDLEEADFYMQQNLIGEAEVIYQRILSIAPNHPHALVRLGEIAAQRGDDPGSSASGLVPPVAEPQEPVAEENAEAVGEDLVDWTAEESSGGSDDFVPDEISVDDDTGVDVEIPAPLEDIDVEIDVEMDLDEAEAPRAAPEITEPEVPPVSETPVPVDFSHDAEADEIGTGDEEDPGELLDWDEEGEEPAPTGSEPAVVEPHAPPLAAAAEEAPAVVAADANDPGFDLAAELSGALEEGDAASGSLGGTSDEGFEAVFAAFKRGVSQTLSEGDHETHYDLGIAYREMGLMEDATGEFRAAMGSEAKRLESLHMLGLCALELDRPGEAESHFQELLRDPQLTDEQTLAANFDLGRALEMRGDVAGARNAWEAVAAVDESFCEVGERLENLATAEKPDQDDAQETDDFESFDDLVAEANEDVEADADASPATEEFESFDDVISEADADDDEPIEEAPPELEPEEEPEPVAESQPPPRKRRKKISFV